MWEKYKNQIIMAVVGTMLTGVVGWTGKALFDAYTHVHHVYHPTSDQIQQILTTVQANEFRLNQIRYNYLLEKKKTAGLDTYESMELSDLTAKLFPGGLPQ